MPDQDDNSTGACRVDDSDDPARRVDFDPETTDRPVVVWDGDCGFCRRTLDWLRDRTGDRLHYAPYQRVVDHYRDLGLSEEDFSRAVHLVEPDGVFYSGAEAIFRALDHAPEGSAGATLYDRVPGFGAASERVYRAVADHRPLCNRLASLAIGDPLRPARWRISRWLYLRAAALVFLIAFLSLAPQIPGLIGESGIQPAADFLDRVRRHAQGGGSVFRFPTLFWWVDPSTGALTGVCWSGAALSVLLFIGSFQRLALAGIWVLYLSLSTVAGPFLGYQWDVLVLEMAFLSIFLAPPGVSPRGGARRVSRAARWMLYWLLFRLVFMSGVVKLTSGDPTWRGLTALEYHFWTQPLPAWTSYWADQLPGWILIGGAVWTFFAELVVPFGIVGPRRVRRWTAGLLGLLQLGIAVTGNYGFFNLATAALCLLLVDDQWWLRVAPDWAVRRRVEDPDERKSLENEPGLWQIGMIELAVVGKERALAVVASDRGEVDSHGLVALRRAARWGTVCVAAGVLTVTTVGMFDRFYGRGANPLPVPGVVRSAVDAAGPFRTLNTYGLFADMTERRPELIVQGSRDGEQWKTYDFAWKPDDVDERPSFVQPHMPRLDWQMWFQALRWYRIHQRTGRCGQSRWYARFQRRLLEGNQPVLDLLEENPFPEDTPRYVRTVAYEYRFAPVGGDGWWTRERLGQWCPTLTLTSDGGLKAVRGSPGR